MKEGDFPLDDTLIDFDIDISGGCMNKLQKAKEEYEKLIEGYIVDNVTMNYIEELESSNKEMLETLKTIRNELFPYKGNPTKDHDTIIDFIVAMCDRKIEKNTGKPTEEVI